MSDPILDEFNKLNQELGKLMERLNQIERWIGLQGTEDEEEQQEILRIESYIRMSHDLGE